MQLEQMILRPAPKLMLIQYVDRTGRSGVTVVPVGDASPAAAEAFAALVAWAEAQLPADGDSPEVAEIKVEMAAVELRLEGLRKRLAAAEAAAVEERVEPITP